MRGFVFFIFGQCLLALRVRSAGFYRVFFLSCFTVVSPEVLILEFESPQFCKFILLRYQFFVSLYLVLKYFVSFIFQLNHITHTHTSHTHDHLCFSRVYAQYD